MVSSFERFFPARILAVLAAFACAALGFAVVSPAARADDTSSWTVRTALSQYGSDRSLFSYTAKPGDTLTDGIDIANRGSSPISLKIYASDGFTSDTGGFDILTPDKESKDVGAWVTPATESIAIQAGQEVQVPFNLVVPANATPGDHMGGIVTVLDQQDASESGTVIHQRVGLRIKVRVSGTLTPELKVENFKVGYDGSNNPFGTGKATLTYTVRNTGNAVLSGLQTAKLSGGFGSSLKTVKLDRLPELLPGETWKASVPIKKVHAMLWVSGKLTVTPVITDAAGSTSTLDPVTASGRASVSAWSWIIPIVALVLLVAIIWLLFLGVRRWRRTAKARAEAKIAAAVEEALKEEARKQ